MQLKRILITLLVVILMISATAMAASAATTDATFGIAVAPTTAPADGDLLYSAGDRIDVSITITNNPGVSILEFVVAYDSEALTLDGTPTGLIYNFANAGTINTSKAGEVRFVSDMSATNDLNTTGVVAKLSFKVKDTFHGDTAVKLATVNPINKSFDVVAAEATDMSFGVHKLSEKITEAAKCGVEGKVYQKCTAAGCTFEKVLEIKPALKHNLVDIDAVAAKCDKEGSTKGKKCSLCETVTIEPKPVEKIPHTPEDVAAVAPTCKDTGLTAGKRCTVCTNMIEAQEVVPALNHPSSSIKVIPAVDAACATEGSTAGMTCTLCNEVLSAPETVAAKGHKYGDWKVTKEATKKEAGSENCTCATCGDVQVRAIAKLEGCGSTVIGMPIVLCVATVFGATMACKKKED